MLKKVLMAISWLNIFFVFRTVRIWNTENPKKNKTVIKTKNKQGKIIYLALTPVYMCRSIYGKVLQVHVFRRAVFGKMQIMLKLFIFNHTLREEDNSYTLLFQ